MYHPVPIHRGVINVVTTRVPARVRSVHPTNHLPSGVENLCKPVLNRCRCPSFPVLLFTNVKRGGSFYGETDSRPQPRSPSLGRKNRRQTLNHPRQSPVTGESQPTHFPLSPRSKFMVSGIRVKSHLKPSKRTYL